MLKAEFLVSSSGRQLVAQHPSLVDMRKIVSAALSVIVHFCSAVFGQCPCSLRIEVLCRSRQRSWYPKLVRYDGIKNLQTIILFLRALKQVSFTRREMPLRNQRRRVSTAGTLASSPFSGARPCQARHHHRIKIIAKSCSSVAMHRAMEKYVVR